MAEVVGAMLQEVSASLSLHNPLLGVVPGTLNTHGETYEATLLVKHPADRLIVTAFRSPSVCPDLENATTAVSTAFILDGRSGYILLLREHSVVWCEADRHRSHLFATCAFPVKHNKNKDRLIWDHLLFLLAAACRRYAASYRTHANPS